MGMTISSDSMRVCLHQPHPRPDSDHPCSARTMSGMGGGNGNDRNAQYIPLNNIINVTLSDNRQYLTILGFLVIRIQQEHFFQEM